MRSGATVRASSPDARLQHTACSTHWLRYHALTMDAAPLPLYPRLTLACCVALAAVLMSKQTAAAQDNKKKATKMIRRHSSGDHAFLPNR